MVCRREPYGELKGTRAVTASLVEAWKGKSVLNLCRHLGPEKATSDWQRQGSGRAWGAEVGAGGMRATSEQRTLCYNELGACGAERSPCVASPFPLLPGF